MNVLNGSAYRKSVGASQRIIHMRSKLIYSISAARYSVSTLEKYFKADNTEVVHLKAIRHV